jgi:hypothetical protein
VVVGQAGEEEVATANGGGEVRVGAAAEEREGGDGGAVGVEEEREERGQVVLAEVAVEGTRGVDGFEWMGR